MRERDRDREGESVCAATAYCTILQCVLERASGSVEGKLKPSAHGDVSMKGCEIEKMKKNQHRKNVWWWD